MKTSAPRAKCPSCEQGRLTHRLVSRKIRVREGSIVVKGLFVEVCDTCEEEIIAAPELRRAQEIARCLLSERSEGVRREAIPGQPGEQR